MLIDTHCHLNDTEKFEDVAGEIGFARENGVGRMILVGVKPEEWSFTLELVHKYEELFCILGWHPNYTKDYEKKQLGELERLAGSEKCLAIGEIGLDHHWDFSPPDTQLRALIDQLDLAEKLNLPVVFHAREAYSDLLDVLESRAGRPYLLHCFAGSIEDARRAVKLDCYFGVDGPITYKKADDLRGVIKTVPMDRLVVETDAPYLTPVPFRGKLNRPGYVYLVNKALGEVLGVSESECAALTTANAERFFTKVLAT
jgi:TatD DNase family protein